MNWEDNVRRVVPYIPGEQPAGKNLIKLNTNECPYPPSPKMLERIRSFETDALRLYPDPECSVLVRSLAEYYGVDQDQVFVGVGSDDVLATAFMTFFNSHVPVLFPDITYSFYDVWAELFGIPYNCPPLKEDFHICMQDYLVPNGGIILPNPNAPTGLMEENGTIEAIVRANPASVVIIDEAYVDFGGTSALPLVDKYENLLVVQTFSKSRAMAGMRIGFAIGSRKLISYMKDVKFSFNSYTMNRPSLEWGTACVEDESYFRETTAKIIEVREWVKEELHSMGFTFPDSKANFIFASHETCPAAEMYEALKKEGIYVRYFKRLRIDNYLRITIGTAEQMEQFLIFVREYLKNRLS